MRLFQGEGPGERRAVTGLLVIGLFLRLGFAVAAFAGDGEYDPYARLGGDTEKYLAIGLSLSRGEGFSLHYGPVLSEALEGSRAASPPVPTANRSPGYPLFLALIFATLGSDLRVLVLLQAILSGLTPLFVYQIARQLKAWPIFCLTVAVFYYPFAFDPIYLMSDWIFTLCTAASLWLLTRSRNEFLSGMVAGAAVLVKSVTLPFLLLGAFVPGRRGWIYLAGLLSAIGPWGYRNYLHTDVPYVTPALGGYSFFLLHNTTNAGLPLWDRPGDQNEYYPGFQDAVATAKARAARVADPVAQEYLEDNELLQEALTFIRSDPSVAARAMWGSLVNTWRTEYPTANPIRWLSSLVLYVGLIPFVLLGCVQAIRQGPPGARLLCAFLLYFVGVHALLASEIRYRTAAMPAFFVLAGYGAAVIRRDVFERRSGVARRVARAESST